MAQDDVPMITGSSAVRSALVLFAVGLVLATCLAGVWLWNGLRTTSETRTTTRSALLAWQSVYSRVKDAEMGVVGYVVSGEKGFLDSFRAAADQLPRLTMQAVTAEQARGEDRLPAAKLEDVHRRIQNLLRLAQETLTVTEREGRANAMELLQNNQAQEQMDGVRRFFDDHLADLDRKLRTLDQRMREALRMGGRAMTGLVLATLFAGGSAALLLRQALAQARRNEQLANEKLKAEHSNREKSVFLATMSHEIRTPMNAILGFGELLLGDARDEKQKRYATSIVRSGQSLLQLINDILDFSKIEAGMVEVATDPIDVRELADFTRQLFAHQFAENGVLFEVEVEDWIPRSLMLDGARLRQVVVNLVGNAAKFTPAGTVWLRFRGQPPDETQRACQLSIEVSDTGVGIPPDRLEHIFDPFVQAKAHRDAEQKGTGLGLAIVKRLTTLMGGTVSVRSGEGHGTTFVVELPEVEISARLAQSSIPTAETPVDFNELQPAVLLVVDDNPENLSVLQGYFDGTHHTLVTAAHGRQALDWLESHPPSDAVLMDIRMPVMDGRTALEEIRRRNELKMLPVIAVTASSMAHEERDLRAAFDGYVRKPFSRAQLFAELSQFIPRVPAVEPGMEELDADDAGPAPESWSALVEALRHLEANTWPAVRDGMVMSDITGFASDLRQLAEQAQCPPVEGYATRLMDEAESFALEALESRLAEFPALVSLLESRVRAAKS
jgi:signal transduction histidine kinase/CheY-like chemotaxis protein